MSRFVTHMKEQLLDTCLSMPDGKEFSAAFWPDPASDFAMDCFLRAVKVGAVAGLLARICYYFPETVPGTVEDVFRYTDVLNTRLKHSQVFVVKDLDGDRGYYLRMDAVLEGGYSRNSISAFLDDVTEDVDILLRYFRPPAIKQDLTSPKIIKATIASLT
ncbi:MAG: hypothetical protein AAFR58_19610 [Cyanobacteria bacterium J06627_28]